MFPAGLAAELPYNLLRAYSRRGYFFVCREPRGPARRKRNWRNLHFNARGLFFANLSTFGNPASGTFARTRELRFVCSCRRPGIIHRIARWTRCRERVGRSVRQTDRGGQCAGSCCGSVTFEFRIVSPSTRRSTRRSLLRILSQGKLMRFRAIGTRRRRVLDDAR